MPDACRGSSAGLSNNETHTRLHPGHHAYSDCGFAWRTCSANIAQMNISSRLAALMRRRGIRSQSQLARISGVPQSSIHRILTRGEDYSVGTVTLRKLAGALDSSVAWLTEGAEVMSAHAGQRISLGAQPPPATKTLDDGDMIEAVYILQRLSPDERRKVIAVLRLLRGTPEADADRPSNADRH